MNLLLKIQHILEIHRLERRYTRRAHRSTTWTDSAVYVDGEYVYPTHSSSTVASPSPTTSTSSSPTAGYSFDHVSAGARRTGRGRECKRASEGGSEGRRTWSGRGRGEKGTGTGTGKRASVGVWVREVVGR